MQVYELTAPSAWASYLINGDASGIELDDVAQCDAWLAREGLGLPCSCDDAGFMWRHDASREMPLGADCQTYTFLVDELGEPDPEPVYMFLAEQDDAADVLRDLGRA